MEYTALKLGAEENGTVRIELGWYRALRMNLMKSCWNASKQ